MSLRRTSIVLAAALLLAGFTRLLAQAEKEVAPDHFGRAKRAYDAGQYLIARKYFTYLDTSPAKLEVVLGDEIGRASCRERVSECV